MGKVSQLSKYIAVEFESREGVSKMLEYMVSGWTDFQGQDKEESTVLETANDQILEFIRKVATKPVQEGNEEDGVIGSNVLTLLQKISDRINKQYDVTLNPYFKKKSITSDQDKKMVIQDITNLLILMDVLLMHHDIEELDESDNISKKIFLDGKIDQKPFGIKNFLVKTIGKFLVLANNNIIEYGNTELDAKLFEYKKQFFARVMFFVFNVSWLPKERTYKNTLVLNLLQSLELGDEADDYGDIMTQVLSYTQTVKNLNPSIVRECTMFHEYTLPQYLEWKQLEVKDRTFKPLGEVEEYHILFAKKLGFFTVDTIQSNGNSDIVRAGYPLVNGHFVWENVPMGDKTRKKVIYQ
ncbi:hypothetical protein [Flammeovirga agarivorans]|uniref:Uncharacterized protein n=1 Tax=Flammeovirga agarivorans TaxID=2726742 RepID=A0A7X8SQ50_9BACT|nr:hypothetical protein [Flammeovirga agarivorans]NLR94348.1 hypothetical protein [Flammeovirga agarivorans]